MAKRQSVKSPQALSTNKSQTENDPQHLEEEQPERVLIWAGTPHSAHIESEERRSKTNVQELWHDLLAVITKKEGVSTTVHNLQKNGVYQRMIPNAVERIRFETAHSFLFHLANQILTSGYEKQINRLKPLGAVGREYTIDMLKSAVNLAKNAPKDLWGDPGILNKIRLVMDNPAAHRALSNLRDEVFNSTKRSRGRPGNDPNTIKRAKELHNQGKKPEAIAELLNKEHPKPRDDSWTAEAVRAMVRKKNEK